VPNPKGLGMIYVSFRFLPLADAIAIVYVLPFILLFLGHYLMGETVGLRRVIAAVVGFAGTLMVIQPSFAAVGWNAFWPLIAALVFAFFILVTRYISRDIAPAPLQALTGVFGVLMVIPIMVIAELTGFEDFGFQWPQGVEILWLLGIGVFGAVAHQFMATSLAHAPSATVAPVQYLEIPVAVAIGWAMFDEFPNGLAFFGICVILGAGLYILWREKALNSEAPPPASAARAAEE
ncbi:MAG: DMT family transporter, partial [Pseudomonadota bacterium]